MASFLFVTSFVGLLTLAPLRKIMIIDYKLAYPSGTATAVLINCFHTPQGDELAKKQVLGFTKFFSLSFFVGLVPMVLLWRRAVWLQTVPCTGVESMETIVHFLAINQFRSFLNFSWWCYADNTR